MTSMDRLHELNRELYSAHTGIGFGVIASSKQTAVPTVGGWVELDRTTLGSAADTISVTGLADKRYYMFLIDHIPTGNTNYTYRLNGDTAGNYANRQSGNGGADNTNGGATGLTANLIAAVQTPAFHLGYLANLSAKEKLAIFWNNQQSTAGSGTAPIRHEGVGKHVQTSNPISSFQFFNADAGSFDTGSEVVILGWDPADVHTTNFWEELVSLDERTSADLIDSGTFTAKKYLWIQLWVDSESGTIEPDYRFNSDSGTSYAGRFSANGATDATLLNKDRMFGSGGTAPFYMNMFFINKSSNEKLGIEHLMHVATAGSGTPPTRRENWHKWINTSSQITSFQVHNLGGSGDFKSGVGGIFLKIWGSN